MSVLDVFNPNLGVAVREHYQAHSILRLPRTESLRILPKSGMSDMFMALVACEELSRSSLKRGEARKIFGDGTSGGTHNMPFIQFISINSTSQALRQRLKNVQYQSCAGSM